MSLQNRRVIPPMYFACKTEFSILSCLFFNQTCYIHPIRCSFREKEIPSLKPKRSKSLWVIKSTNIFKREQRGRHVGNRIWERGAQMEVQGRDNSTRVATFPLSLGSLSCHYEQYVLLLLILALVFILTIHKCSKYKLNVDYIKLPLRKTKTCEEISYLMNKIVRMNVLKIILTR